MADTIKIGNLEIDNLKVGTLSVDALYIGDVKIYPLVVSPKYVLTLSDSSTVSARCDGTSAVTSGEVASQYSGSVVSAEIGDCVTSIGDYAFRNCSRLTSCTIGSGVTTIGIAAFVNCSGLIGNFDIPNSVTTIGSNAFRPCSGLTSITIGTGISSIGMYAFYGCSSLTSITINATTPPRLSNANAFTNTNNCPIYVPCGSVDTYKSASGWSSLASRITCVQPKTLQWVSYSEGDTIPSNDVYNTYGFRIPTQVVYDIVDNGKEVSMAFYSEELDHEQHSVSMIEFAFPYEGGAFFTINGQSQEISYDPESDEYLEIIFSDYGVNYNYNVTSFNYGEQGDTEMVYEFPFGMDLYEEDTPTPQTLQWVTFNNGDTIPSDLDIYGISGVSQNLYDTFGYGTHFQFTPSRNKFDWFIVNNSGHTCYFGESVLNTEVISVICSEVSCDDYYNQGATVSGTIQLYIYA